MYVTENLMAMSLMEIMITRIEREQMHVQSMKQQLSFSDHDSSVLAEVAKALTGMLHLLL